MKANDEVNSKIDEKWAELGPDWSKLAKIGQKYPKLTVLRSY